MPAVDTSRLAAVNTMLSMSRIEAVNSLDNAVSADTALAIRILDEVDRAVQARGWHWNTECYTSTQDADGRHVWGEDWIQFDIPSPDTIDIARRGGFVFDKEKGTNLIGRPTLKGELVRYLALEDIPEIARQYIVIRAANTFHMRVVSDPDLGQRGAREESEAYRNLLQDESEQGDYNVFEAGAHLKVMNRPYGLHGL